MEINSIGYTLDALRKLIRLYLETEEELDRVKIRNKAAKELPIDWKIEELHLIYTKELCLEELNNILPKAKELVKHETN